jgi:Uma2 family endonuclease
MQITERTFEDIVLANPGRKLEMYEGQVREKPQMSIGHIRMEAKLFLQLATQWKGSAFEVRMSRAPVRRSARNYSLPDAYVVPRHPRGVPLQRFEEFADPLPYVAEIWSPSTGAYDIDEKLPGYRDRGDREIWRLHPLEPRVRACRGRPNGSYEQLEFESGAVELHALRGVFVDLDDLFDLD